MSSCSTDIFPRAPNHRICSPNLKAKTKRSRRPRTLEWGSLGTICLEAKLSAEKLVFGQGLGVPWHHDFPGRTIASRDDNLSSHEQKHATCTQIMEDPQEQFLFIYLGGSWAALGRIRWGKSSGSPREWRTGRRQRLPTSPANSSQSRHFQMPATYRIVNVMENSRQGSRAPVPTTFAGNPTVHQSAFLSVWGLDQTLPSRFR
jgi:hypothetical protein